ncbi:MAG: hypothetical protein HN919_02850 [Verrucomicrobia bacterium]|nr:hypothetical protein [Verrucomicrobiota bacterium]MBT7065214.1 hypothetical protein [Verrucomicrobiota bacterium]MBT7700896.1 hypothetical protein [Verrucomicrobiota bacterium]
MKRLIYLGLLLAALSGADASHDWDGSPTLPVHRIPLMDENGAQILAGSEAAMPISTRKTCIQCHDYDAIAQGWHFSASGDVAGCATEPWVLVDEKSGTQIPLSKRGAKGCWSPQDLGMSDWDVVKQFGRHMPGGGPGEGEHAPPDPEARWTVSGDLEINCFACHNTGPHQDMTEWVKQIARENFRWAGTAAACLGSVEGVASRLPATWNPSDGVDPDDLVWRVPPSVTYHATLFDHKNRALLDLGKPTDARCLQCHAVTRVGETKHHVTGDVHSDSGMSCVSCHRNGIDHKIDRGIDGRHSCRGCHMGATHGDTPAGTYGAPVPAHKGLPPVHLDKLACTTCHSGIAIDHGPAVVRTSCINRLGIHGRAQWMTEAPLVVEPVFMKDGDGRIAPHRMLWPAFWARRQGDDLAPIKAETVMEMGGDILDPAMAVARILALLSRIKDGDGNPYGQPVFVSQGALYQADVDGGLDRMTYDGPPPPASLTFGYMINGTLQPMAELYDATDINAFYYQDESRQAHVINLLAALRELAPEGADPAWILQGKRHMVKDATYEPVPPEELAALREAAAKAKVEVDALAAKLDVAAEVDGTKQKFYRKSDKTELKASKSKTPELYKLKLLMKAQGKAEAALNELEIIGDKAYRNTFQKNTSRYPVIEEFAAAGTNGSAWVWIKDDKVLPLIPVAISDLIADTSGSDTTVLTEPQVGMVLARLGERAVYVSGGKLFSRQDDGTLAASDHPRAAPVAWPIGHDVRPAAQSLGAAACSECHSAEAPFLFAEVTAQGPLTSEQVAAAAMVSFMGLDGGFNRLFGLSFMVRPLFKAGMLGLALIAALVLLAWLLAGIRSWSLQSDHPALERTALLGGFLSTVLLALTGFGGMLQGHLGGYPLLTHTAAGALFALCLAVLALLKARHHLTPTVQSACFWLLLVCAVVLILTVLVAMVPLLDTHAQHGALALHTLAAVVFVAALALYAFMARRS